MKKILLTFDVEEFDIPGEYGQQLSIEEQLEVTSLGLQEVIALLDKYQIRCTFFTTAVYAINKPEFIKEIARHHEIASHGYYHSSFENADLRKSKMALEKLLQTNISGYRMARLAPVDDLEIQKAGYHYNSSLNPTWIPGRYNNLKKPRIPFVSNHIWNIPTSVTPTFRIPLFWLSFKVFPMWFLKMLMLNTLRHDQFLSLYFHPWEFIDIRKYKLPHYIKRKSGEKMLQRIEETITLLKDNAEFVTMDEFITDYNRQKSI
jgi:peptidoglycan/xylan/chitin deacetylase (PgdA/CDA1 family)